jgi:hypothetical protein
MSEAVNPYAAPAARVENMATNPEADAIRRAHLNHEASIKAVGALYYIGGAVMTIAGLMGAVGAPRSEGVALLLFIGAFGVAQLVVAWGVRAFRPWGRVVGIILSVIGLIGFPIGTLISAYILYLLLSKKGRTIFSPEYQDVIAATPYAKYKTSIIVWIFLALILALLVITVGVTMIGGKS